MQITSQEGESHVEVLNYFFVDRWENGDREMNYTSLMFKPHLVLKMIRGDKTITRRPLKEQPDGVDVVRRTGSDGVWTGYKNGAQEDGQPLFMGKRPKYEIGDIIRVREPWSTDVMFDHMKPSEILDVAREKVPIWYGADNELYWYYRGAMHKDSEDIGSVMQLIDPVRGKKRSSMFMPNWAARLLLKIVDLDIERVLDITEEDAMAEGAEPDPNEWQENGVYKSSCTYRLGFLALWNQINRERGMSVDVNPLVWRIVFETLYSSEFF